MARTSQASSKRSSPRVTALFAFCLAGGWVWLVAGTHLHEMMVGAGVVILATLFLKAAHESSQTNIRLRWKDIAQGWRIPWYMVCDTWVVTLAFFRDLLHLRSAGNHYRACGFKCSKRVPGDPGPRGSGHDIHDSDS